ncbi:hypothetical protein PACTADRAFT_773 [Pachysolen tannophilus NRRL Y-2460]|uniref:Thiamine-binding protein domain-containing protein n=1 Tax=Pachysolen tannophilus NRRL Y-2460 TaxID=669874 RepID=A0A1E4U315_PACTA|nr:hypothetical protein PACTADRAFT_773 [Pachysolen tannophilus NRRL Y-2460]
MVCQLRCIADVCLIPIGTGSPSVSNYVAQVENLIRKSNLKSTLHSAGTTIEGPWNEVMDLVGQAHELCHEMGVLRVQSDIRVGSRIDKKQTAADKVNIVEDLIKNMK